MENYCGCRIKMKVLGIVFFILPMILSAQTLDYETIKDSKPIKVTGQVNTNGVYYDSNQNNNRDPFTYFLQGGINVNIYSFAIPITYSFSNQGENLGYQLPFNFNRLSLHPKYKWITGHIGNTSMTFSPYSLSGHPFTGGGIELQPKGPFKVSAMGGELLKATPDDGDPRTIPAYRRMGYGMKAAFEKQNYKLGLIGFYAKDDFNSVTMIPAEREILPQENLVISVEGMVKINKNFDLQLEYASSAITRNLNTQQTKKGDNTFSLAGLFFNNRTSTEYYKAVKTRFGYSAGGAKIGVGYERIDPGYETLGATFFNNDFENITLDASNNFFNNKLSLSFNVGYQRDDLNNTKVNETSRTVGAVNASWMLSKKVNVTANYSNFTTFTNIKPNQFDEINDADLVDEESRRSRL